jgi:hypothetical protein
MSCQETRTAASGFLVELEQFLAWLSGEFAINKAIATTLWERMSWMRDTVTKDKSFQMTFPFMGFLAASHVEDVQPLYTSRDPLGLRNRIELFYSKPSFKRYREIKEANEETGNNGSDELRASIADLFLQVGVVGPSSM